MNAARIVAVPICLERQRLARCGDTVRLNEWPQSSPRLPKAAGPVGSDVCKPARLEVALSRSFFDRAEDVLDRASSNVHGVGHMGGAGLHSLDHVLMFPAGEPTLLAGCAVGFERACAAVAGPVTVELHAVLDSDRMLRQCVAGTTPVGVDCRPVEEFRHAEAVSALAPEVSGLRQIGVTPTSAQASTSSPEKSPRSASTVNSVVPVASRACRRTFTGCVRSWLRLMTSWATTMWLLV